MNSKTYIKDNLNKSTTYLYSKLVISFLSHSIKEEGVILCSFLKADTKTFVEAYPHSSTSELILYSL